MTGTNPDPSLNTDLRLPADRRDPETVAVRVAVKKIVGCARDDRAESVEVRGIKHVESGRPEPEVCYAV